MCLGGGVPVGHSSFSELKVISVDLHVSIYHTRVFGCAQSLENCDLELRSLCLNSSGWGRGAILKEI